MDNLKKFEKFLYYNNEISLFLKKSRVFWSIILCFFVVKKSRNLDF